MEREAGIMKTGLERERDTGIGRQESRKRETWRGRHGEGDI